MKKLIVTTAIAFVCALSNATQYKTGLIFPKSWETLTSWSGERLDEIDVPARFNWEEKLAFTPPIKNQGPCGSCWAFASVGVIEYLVKASFNRYQPLSEQELVSCDRNNYGCGGGFTGFKYTTGTGIAATDEFPYAARNLRCKQGLDHVEKTVSWAYLGTSGASPTEGDIKQAIYQYGPVWADVYANNAFMNWKPSQGAFKRCVHGFGTNHAIMLTGWDDSKKAWRLRNSWGDQWGDKGFMDITYGCNNVGSVVAYASVK